jgi:hypothetical protein
MLVYQRVSGKAPPLLLVGIHPPNAGLIHLAAVLDDATMPKLTRGHLEKSYGAKVRSFFFRQRAALRRDIHMFMSKYVEYHSDFLSD